MINPVYGKACHNENKNSFVYFFVFEKVTAEKEIKVKNRHTPEHKVVMEG